MNRLRQLGSNSTNYRHNNKLTEMLQPLLSKQLTRRHCQRQSIPDSGHLENSACEHSNQAANGTIKHHELDCAPNEMMSTKASCVACQSGLKGYKFISTIHYDQASVLSNENYQALQKHVRCILNESWIAQLKNRMIRTSHESVHP
jgi:hypothetical protein